MAAETARKFEALEAQAQKLMSVFIDAGHEAVSPAVIQPADVFLDVIGEQLRARTYVFIDPNGDELCLRPDLTVPACRLHLERHKGGDVVARYCYNGPAFRYQPAGSGASHPREFRQAGIESFAGTDMATEDAGTLATIVAALKSAGLKDWTLKTGDLGLFSALLSGLDMPERWRRRLRHKFWQPQAFRAELKRLATRPADAVAGVPGDLLANLDIANSEKSESAVARYLEQNGKEVIGVRSLGEITASLIDIAQDATAKPLAAKTAEAIESYLAIRAPADAVGKALDAVKATASVDIGAAQDLYQKRIARIATAGLDPGKIAFSAEFGRALAYYTGFVFEIVAPGLGTGSPIAGGGRYDNLLKAAGAPSDVPAVGAAIHTERLLAAVTGELP